MKARQQTVLRCLQKPQVMNNNIEENLDLEDELFEHYRFEVPKGQAFLRIDKYLMYLIPNATRNKIQNAATNGNIFVNDIPVKSNYKVKPFDVITVMLSHPPFENRVDQKIFRWILFMRMMRYCLSINRRDWWCTQDMAIIQVLW